MSYTVVTEKLRTLPESYMEEVSDFLDFLLFKSKGLPLKNGLDKAIEEVERGEVEVFSSFDEFKTAMTYEK